MRVELFLISEQMPRDFDDVTGIQVENGILVISEGPLVRSKWPLIGVQHWNEYEDNDE